MEKVCRLGRRGDIVSPLCNNWDLYNNIKEIITEKGLDIEVVLGIVYKESHIGTNFAPSQECSRMNNWGGLKAYKTNDGRTLAKNLPYEGCWLYPFDSIEEFFIGLSNTLKEGYIDRGCDNLTCLSKRYVGTPGVVNNAWIRGVEYFIKN